MLSVAEFFEAASSHLAAIVPTEMRLVVAMLKHQNTAVMPVLPPR